jgi:hypothetical protein
VILDGGNKSSLISLFKLDSVANGYKWTFYDFLYSQNRQMIGWDLERKKCKIWFSLIALIELFSTKN